MELQGKQKYDLNSNNVYYKHFEVKDLPAPISPDVENLTPSLEQEITTDSPN